MSKAVNIGEEEIIGTSRIDLEVADYTNRSLAREESGP